MTPTARSLALCRELGWQVEVVERWVHFGPRKSATADDEPRTGKVSGIRKDVWGFGDLLVLVPGTGITLVQATSDERGGHHATRERKITTECLEQALRWMQHGGVIQVWSWAKRGPRGKRKVWRPRMTQLDASAGTWSEVLQELSAA